jgi:hypothetical protein
MMSDVQLHAGPHEAVADDMDQFVDCEEQFNQGFNNLWRKVPLA